MTSSSFKVGDLAEKYEVGRKGPGYISNGSKWGDPGGDSYGSYQLESSLGTLQAYLKQNDKYAQQLKGLAINSAAFKAKWKEIAAADPVGFQQSQFDYLASKKNGYYDAVAHAANLGWNVGSFAMLSAIFSTSNQSGRWRAKIFDRAGIKSSDPIELQINKLYDARARYFREISIDEKVRESILEQRTVLERKDCLKLI